MRITKMMIVEEARKFGECFLGDESFDVIKHTKSWNNFLRKNNIEDCFLTKYDDGWFLVCP